MHKNTACVNLLFSGSVSDLTGPETSSANSPRLLECDAFVHMSFETVSRYRSDRHEIDRPD